MYINSNAREWEWPTDQWRLWRWLIPCRRWMTSWCDDVSLSTLQTTHEGWRCCSCQVLIASRASWARCAQRRSPLHGLSSGVNHWWQPAIQRPGHAYSALRGRSEAVAASNKLTINWPLHWATDWLQHVRSQLSPCVTHGRRVDLICTVFHFARPRS